MDLYMLDPCVVPQMSQLTIIMGSWFNSFCRDPCVHICHCQPLECRQPPPAPTSPHQPRPCMAYLYLCGGPLDEPSQGNNRHRGIQPSSKPHPSWFNNLSSPKQPRVLRTLRPSPQIASPLPSRAKVSFVNAYICVFFWVRFYPCVC